MRERHLRPALRERAVQRLALRVQACRPASVRNDVAVGIERLSSIALASIARRAAQHLGFALGGGRRGAVSTVTGGDDIGLHDPSAGARAGHGTEIHALGRGHAYMRQHKALGLGHAVWCARRLIGNEAFAVILPDDVIAAEKPCLQQMVEAYAETGGNLVAAMEVPADRASSYGILDVLEDMGSIVSVKGMVEKPEKGSAPSNLAVIGRYILSPNVLRNLNKMKAGAGGEIQLTDAIAQEIGGEEGVYGLRFRGERFDCGSKAGFLQATVAFGLARDELKDDLRRFLIEVLAAEKAAE